jgi:hypothetical protein
MTPVPHCCCPQRSLDGFGGKCASTVYAHLRVYNPAFCSSSSISLPHHNSTTLLSHQCEALQACLSSIHPSSIPSDILIDASNKHFQQRHPPCVSPSPSASSLGSPPSVPSRPSTRQPSLLTRQARSNSRPSRAIGTSAATRITTAPTTKETAPLPVLTVRCRPVPTWTATNVGRASLARDR